MPKLDLDSIRESTSHFTRRTRKKIRTYRLRRRRAKASRRRTTSRKMLYTLSVVLLALLSGYFWALDYVSPDVGDRTELSLDQFRALAAETRLATVEFRDEDDRIVGEWLAEPIVPPVEKDRDKKADQNDKKGEEPKGEETDEQAGGEEEAGGGGAAAGGEESGGPKAEKDEDGKNAKKDEEPKKPVEPPSPAPEGAGLFYTPYSSSGAMFGILLDELSDSHATVTVDPQSTKTAVRTVGTYLLPLLILATVFGLLFSVGRGGGSGIGEVMTFGTIGKKKQKKGFVAPVTFNDVAGADEAVAEMREVVDYLSDPERYEELGALPPKGVLLFGPPGCGKTLIAKAVAGEAGVPFFSVAGAEFVESLVGVGAARVRDLFLRVRAVAPAIVFIDELDAVGRKRGAGGGSGGSDEREQTLNQLLVEMDGFEVESGIVVVGATNRPDILDPALLRPGRFDRHVTVDQPDLTGRQLILELHARDKPMGPAVDFPYLAKRTPGFSGADLANVINEGTLLTIREGLREVDMPHLEEAIQRVLHGPKRRGRVLTPEERTRAAYHESGHAVVAAAVGRAEDVHRVTILARGRGLGLTGITRETDALLVTRSQLYGQLVTAMGGLAAEELVLREPSTGAEQDLEEATELARDIVGRFGMSPRLGRVRLLASDADQFLSGDTGITQLSEQVHEDMDAEVRRLLDSAEEDALRVLGAHRAVLDRLAKRLDQDETIEGKELDTVLAEVPTTEVDIPGIEVSSNGHASKERPAGRPEPSSRGRRSAD